MLIFYLVTASLSIGAICGIVSYYACVSLINYAPNFPLVEIIHPIGAPYFMFNAGSVIAAVLMICSA
ncbi:MAG: hypothetical protein GYA69_03285 [Candidatus Moranbacteria bacterium]|jgi:hypothetical protein|nr:hypothetical protein [Candidatus Moranbacteria bacterium]